MKHFLFTLLVGTSLIGTACTAPNHSFAQESGRTAGTTPDQAAENKNLDNDTYQQLNLFGEVFERTRAQYVDKISDKEIIEHALNGMLSNLDPHSSYMNEDELNDMKVETQGVFGGLGIEVTMDNGIVKVVSPIDDTPAFRAGIQAGDYITKIDGEPVMGLTLKEAVDKMRGKVGAPIDLEIQRESAEAPINMTITRDVISIQSVRHRVEGNIGYLRITTFNQNTSENLKNAINDIEKQLGDKLIGYILDLRNNPGGLLDQAIEVSDIFLDKGEIVSTRGRYEEDTKRDNATPGDMARELPIVVLINGGSASASEIVAGALQDHKRAIIMGVKSFGKGSVQTIIPLHGNGAMRLTTARYYTPSGRSIQAKGIEPDIIVEPAKVELLDKMNFSEANLRGALKNPQDEAEEKTKTEDTSKEEIKKPDAAKPDANKSAEKTEPDTNTDYQLTRALDLLSGLSMYGTGKETKQEK